MEGHPTKDDFARFLQQSPRPSRPERNALVVRHLLGGCGVCRGTLCQVKGAVRLLSRLLDIVPGERENEKTSSYNYDWAFATAERALVAILNQGQSSEFLPKCLAELASLPEGEQIRRVSAGGHFADSELIRCLIERSHGARYRSPRKTLHLSRLAYLAAEACSSEAGGGEAQLADLKAHAWGAFANAQRICGNLPEAEEAFEVALRECAAGTGSPRVRARLLSQISSLQCYQRRFGNALALAREAEQICCEIGDPGLLAHILIAKATILVYTGEVEHSIELLHQAIPLIDREEDPYLLLAAYHNLARCHIDIDRPEEALAVFCEVRDLYRKCPDPLIALRATWQEGQLLREVGHLRNAEAALLRARQGFTDENLAYEAAIVNLDLAQVYSKLGAADKLRQVVAEAIPIFRSLRIGREVLASLLQLQQAIEGSGPEATDSES